ncbi:MAG TPA: response regulator [Clostridia bacterium]|nr:response regulator [Clostridia bacterium]
MYKLVLVEDEIETLENIVRNIDWETCGFTLAGKALSGQEALSIVDQVKPDLIITDIRMPYMDGFEMIKRVHEKDNSICFLIISGHDEFDYAQLALQYGVLDFIIKPVTKEIIEKSLGKAKAHLDKQYAIRNDMDTLRQQLKESMDLLRSSFLIEILSKGVSDEYFNMAVGSYDLPQRSTFSIIAIQTESTGKGRKLIDRHFSGKQEIMWLALRNLVEEQINADFTSYILQYQERLVIYAFSHKRNLIALCDRIVAAAEKLWGLKLIVGISNPCSSLRNANVYYLQAVRALNLDFVNNEQRVYCYSDLQLEQDESPTLLDLTLDESVIINGEKDDIAGVFDNIAQSLAEAQLSEQRLSSTQAEINSQLLRLADDFDVDVLSKFPVHQIYDHFQDINGWIQLITLIAEYINREIQDKNYCTGTLLMAHAKSYIDENYTDPELSLDRICDHLDISASYFSALFKRDFSQTFLQYLTSLRIQKACSLLLNTDKKSSQIAREVGFTSPNYFSYRFRQYVKTSPVEYRRKGREREKQSQ